MKHEDFTVGWICALSLELAAAVAILDEVYSPLLQCSQDHNNYTLGRIRGHNVAIACLSSGVTGTTSAAVAASYLLVTFPSIRFGLMVGIGGGAPSLDYDIRLGDVVVSRPTATFGGVIQYDFGKTVQEGRFIQTGSLNKPPDMLLKAVSSLEARHDLGKAELPEHLSQGLSKHPKLQKISKYPGAQEDRLFEADYNHPTGNTTCANCEPNRLVTRVDREDEIPSVHYGLIASANQVMRDGVTREKLRKKLNVLCFEMEAAGLMDHFPCLVVRGICDYADTHKNKRWQRYAAAVAAAYAKELLGIIPEHHIARTQTATAEMVPRSTTMSQSTIVASIPPSDIFNVPFHKNRFFRGRSDFLEDLARYLLPSRKRQTLASCLVHGIPGMGKSQLALEYAYQNRKSYRCVFWIGSETLPGLGLNFASIADLLGVSDQSMGPERKIEIAKEWLENTDKPWLIIFDNVNDWNDIKTYLPNKPEGAVLITTQIAATAQLTQSGVCLSPLDRKDGSNLLLDHVQKQCPSESDVAESESLSEILGGLPIAIAHVAGRILSSQMTLGEARDLFKNQQSEYMWSGEQTSSTHMYSLQLSKVWEFSLHELQPDVLELLYVLAMLDPDSIPERMIVEDAVSDSLTERPEVMARFLEIRESLTKRQLIQRDTLGTEPCLSIHRSLQLDLLFRLQKEPKKKQVAFEKAVALVRRAIPRQHETQTSVYQHWANYERHQPHILSLREIWPHNASTLYPLEDFASLLSDAANYMWERGFANDGIQCAQVAIKIYEKLSQPNRLELAQAYTLLGVVTLEEGISGRTDGLASVIKALELRKEHIESPPPGGSSHEQLLYANAWNDFGCALLEFSNYDEAEKYIRHALAIKERNSTKEKEPMEFGETYMNLALIRASQRRFKDASDLISQAVDLATKAHGFQSASTQSWCFYWAMILFDSGDKKGALEKHLAVLNERINDFGDSGTRTRESYYALGAVHHANGDLKEAERMVRKSLTSGAAPERSQWSKECIARAQYRLSLILRDQRRPKDADELEGKAHETRNALFQDHSTAFKSKIDDEMLIYDHMASYIVGRNSPWKAQIKPLELAADTGIDSSIAGWEMLTRQAADATKEGDLRQS